MHNQSNRITVEIIVDKPVEYVWELWTTAADIKLWNIPFDDWHCPWVENDVKPGGHFLFRMEAKDGSAGFDHSGRYDNVIINELIEYTGMDGRKSVIQFVSDKPGTLVLETFEPENETAVDMQKDFCYAVLKKFKQYAETKKRE